MGTERPVSLLGGCRGGVTVPCPHRSPLGASAMSLGGQETPPVLGGSRSAGERPGGARGGPGQPAAPAHPPGTNQRRHRGSGGCGDKWWLCQHRTRALGMGGQVTAPQGTPGWGEGTPAPPAPQVPMVCQPRKCSRGAAGLGAAQGAPPAPCSSALSPGPWCVPRRDRNSPLPALHNSLPTPLLPGHCIWSPGCPPHRCSPSNPGIALLPAEILLSWPAMGLGGWGGGGNLLPGWGTRGHPLPWAWWLVGGLVGQIAFGGVVSPSSSALQYCWRGQHPVTSWGWHRDDGTGTMAPSAGHAQPEHGWFWGPAAPFEPSSAHG